MNFIKSLARNVGILSKANASTSQISNDMFGMTSLGKSTPEDRQAIYPGWFFSARLGQPRQVDTRKLRELSQSSWVQMVINTFKREIKTIPWVIKAVDQEDENDYTEKIKKITNKLNFINDNGDSVVDINSELITDLAEIDAGVANLVYSSDSYEIGEVPIYDNYGVIIETETNLKLKPFGQRELTQVKSVDGSSMLKQVDLYKNLLRYYQYSFRHPKNNPTPFELAEIQYLIMNNKSYSIYGFSPVQSIQQVLELLIQGTRYNKDFFTNNAIPDILATIPKLPKEDLRKLKREWNNSYKGKPHQIGFLNFPIENFEKLSSNNRDMEWLDGQKWYFKIVFAAFGVSPTEAGFFENANKSNDEGQARVTVRNAIKPYIEKLEKFVTNKIINEILQEENHGLEFKYLPKDHDQEKEEFEQNMKELDAGALTINEYRKTRGKNPVDWGNEPYTKTPSFSDNEQEDNSQDDEGDGEFKKSFEGFMNE